MKESVLHKQITDWIIEALPSVVFNTDSSGIKLSQGLAVQISKLRSGNGFPDISIYEQGSLGTALFLEVKTETPYKKDGTLKKDVHLEAQAEMHKRLIERGYYACFVWSLEMAQDILRKHLGNNAFYN
jgi:hypothetical protein